MTDSLPQRMREAAKVLVEASERHHPGVDQSPPSSKLWSAMELCNLATHWEAEDRAKAEQEAERVRRVDELSEFLRTTMGAAVTELGAVMLARDLDAAGWRKGGSDE